MPPAEIRQRLAALDLSGAAFARIAGCTPRQVYRWTTGQAEMPQWASLLLTLLALPGAVQIATTHRRSPAAD